MTALFNSFFNLLSGIIFPTTPTAVSSIASFGLLFAIVVTVLGFLYKLTGR